MNRMVTEAPSVPAAFGALAFEPSERPLPRWWVSSMLALQCCVPVLR